MAGKIEGSYLNIVVNNNFDCYGTISANGYGHPNGTGRGFNGYSMLLILLVIMVCIKIFQLARLVEEGVTEIGEWMLVIYQTQVIHYFIIILFFFFF